MVDVSEIAILREWTERIATTELPIIVEGPKDKRALEAIGAREVFTLSRKPLFAIAEDIASNFDEVILLTDFDSKGKELYGCLARIFSRLGVKIDPYFRKTLQKHARISHIEGLITVLQTRGAL